MKKINLAIIACLTATMAFGQTPDSSDQMMVLSQKVVALENSLQDMGAQISMQANQIQNLRNAINGVGQQQTTTKKDLESLKEGQNSLGEKVESNAADMRSKTDDINQRMALKDDLNTASSKIKSQGVIFGILAALLFVIAILSYILLQKNIKSSVLTIDEVKKAQDKLQQESISLDEKLMEVLNKKMTIEKAQTPVSSEPDHSLALKVADEIVRIETNLARMDPAVKGYKQLSASLRRIKDNFVSNGYEIVDMLGKPYVDGMKVTANFVPDESLEEGAQIITGIIKPQINYNGKMIQSAQITVSQN